MHVKHTSPVCVAPTEAVGRNTIPGLVKVKRGRGRGRLEKWDTNRKIEKWYLK